MTCTIEKILTDARTLLERLKDHDNAAESLIDQSTVLHKRVAAMKEIGTSLSEKYQEDATDLKDTSKYKPHILLSQENTQIRDLQQENRELWISLEEHQDALELIMSKYRKQMLHLIMGRKDVDAEPVLKVHEAHSVEIESRVDRICEMGEVMRKAVQMDDDQFCKIQEKLAQLEPKYRFCSLKIKSCGSCYPSAKKLSRCGERSCLTLHLKSQNKSVSKLLTFKTLWKPTTIQENVLSLLFFITSCVS
ncbi:suppressor of IKBKE 1 isoform 1-T2 [Macrochelys suwanniensis]